MQKYYLLFAVLICLLSCNDKKEDEFTPPVKMLPENIKTSSRNGGGESHFQYDDRDRIIGINTTTINYISDTEIEVTFLNGQNNQPETISYTVQNDHVYRDGEKYLKINDRGYILERIDKDTVSYTYDKNGNIETATYRYKFWEEGQTLVEEYSYDNNPGPFHYVQSPRWLLSLHLGDDLTNTNTPSKITITNWGINQDPDAGFPFEAVYNTEGYPVSLIKSFYGIAGISSETITIQYK